MDCTYPQALKLAVVPRDVAQTSTYIFYLIYVVGVDVAVVKRCKRFTLEITRIKLVQTMINS